MLIKDEDIFNRCSHNTGNIHRQFQRRVIFSSFQAHDGFPAHTPAEIAKVIAPQFAETDLEDITTIVTRYYEQDTWKNNLIFEKRSFELLQDILAEAGELGERVPYEKLVTTEYAEKAAGK